jgi:hypothetical protein
MECSRNLLSALVALAALSLGACDPAPDPTTDRAPGDTLPHPVADPADRPAESRRTVEIEGMEEEVFVRLYHPPDGFPLPFSTYIPESMAAQEVAAGEGDAVAFVAEFGGQRNEAAAVRLVVAPPGMSVDDLIGLLGAIVEGLEGSLVASDFHLFPWADQEFAIDPRPGRLQGVSGVVGVGTRHDRAFAVAVHYPPEYGDGFAPRASLILDEWRWESGERLAR